jgi:hypothetical protein
MLSPANSPSLPFKNGATSLSESLHQRNPLYTLLRPQSVRPEHIKSDKSEQNILAIDQGRRFSIQSEGVSESDCKSTKGSKPNKISLSDMEIDDLSVCKGRPKQRIVAVHNYHDHLYDTRICPSQREPEAKQPQKRNDRSALVSMTLRSPPAMESSEYKSLIFPEKLHVMLHRLEVDGLQHVCCWKPHGRCFIVGDKKEFLANIVPR